MIEMGPPMGPCQILQYYRNAENGMLISHTVQFLRAPHYLHKKPDAVVLDSETGTVFGRVKRRKCLTSVS